jgi:hypothetical protein
MEGWSAAQEVNLDAVANRLVSDAIEGNARGFGETMTDQMEAFGDNREQKEIFAAGVTGDGSLLSDDLMEKD